MPTRLAHTMVIDRIQLAVYCLLSFASPASRQGHIGINIHSNNTYNNYLRIRSDATIFRYVVVLVMKYVVGLFRRVGMVLPRFAQKIKFSLDTELRKMRLLFLPILAEIQLLLVS